MPLLSLLPDIFVPTFELSVNYVPLPPPIAKQIVDLTVTQHLNPPDSFSFRLERPDSGTGRDDRRAVHGRQPRRAEPRLRRQHEAADRRRDLRLDGRLSG